MGITKFKNANGDAVAADNDASDDDAFAADNGDAVAADDDAADDEQDDLVIFYRCTRVTDEGT